MTRAIKKPLLLCVDDDAVVLRSLVRLFREEPLELLATFQPEVALRWVEKHDVDLLLTDQRMPGMTGTELVEEVLACSPRTACAILTAYPLDSSVLPAFLRGTYDLFSKPWDGATLKSAIRQILRERRIEDREDRGSSGE
jgi:DNA-binding NtrC family response regulator